MKNKVNGKDDVVSFMEYNDLASSTVGGKIIFATDDWFAVAENLLNPNEPVFKEGVFTEFGKWMDGWETRRKRIPGHDWCIIQLGAPGVIHGVNINTRFFTGNYSPRASVQAACLQGDTPTRTGDRMGTRAEAEDFKSVEKLNSSEWETILDMTELGAGYDDTHNNMFKINSEKRWTHIRLNMFPDGGIARFRVYGQVMPDWSEMAEDELIDLAAMLNGGICVGYSNAHYGHARYVISPGRANVMAEGWETARRLDRPAILEADENGILQVPGKEWAEFKLGDSGIIEKIEIDTNHFKGNFPDSCYIEGCYEPSILKPEGPWKILLPPKKLSAHKRHYFESNELEKVGKISHVRLVMAPDGGISRMRLWGRRTERTP